MANVECSVPEHLLLKRTGTIDDAVRFGEWVEYFVPDASLSAERPVLVRVARYEKTFFPKVNRFADERAGGLVGEDGTLLVELEPGKRSRVPVSTLEKKLIQDDSEEEFVAIVEFRVPGIARPVHRSASVFKKCLPALEAQQGRTG